MTTVNKSSRKRNKGAEEISLPVPDAAVYNAFLATIQLKRIELADVTARSTATHQPQVQLKVSQKFAVTCPVRTETSFLAEAQLQLGFQTADGDDLGVISCTYRLEYSSGVTVTDELFNEFARRNVPLNAWPFLRETAMNLTQRFGWSGFVLPAFISLAGRLPELTAPPKVSAETSVKRPSSKRKAATQ